MQGLITNSYRIVSNFGSFTAPASQDMMSTEKKNDSPPAKEISVKELTRNVVTKRTTTQKGMGKFRKITNKKLISGIISNYLLLGENWRNDKEEALQTLEMSPNGHFVLTLKVISGKYKLNGIYMLENDEQINKIYSILMSPDVIVPKMVDKFLQFHPVDKEFTEIVGTNIFHILTDAIVLKSNFEKSSGFFLVQQPDFSMPSKSFKLYKKLLCRTN